MGARGPAPTPKSILEARGSWRAGVAGNATLPIQAPGCPEFLSKEAKAEWRRQVPLLIQMGVIAKIDRALLAMYCEAWGEFVEARQEIDRMKKNRAKPLEITNAGLYNLRTRAFERALKIAAQFGFSSSARARLNAPAHGQEEPDGKDRYFATVG